MPKLSLQEAYQQAKIALHNRDFKLAEKIYKTVLQARPDDLQASYGLSVIALEFNNTTQAMKFLEPFSKVNSREPAFRVQLLNIMYFSAKYQQALQQAEAWCKENPCCEMHTIAGNAARAMGMWDRAEQHYQDYLNEPAVKAEYALLQSMKPEGDIDNALSIISSLAQQFPKALLVLQHAAHIALLSNQPGMAEPWITTALEQKKHNHEAIALYAKLLHQQGDLKGAEIAFNQSIGVNRANPLAYAHLGWLFIDMNRITDANFCFAQAVNLSSACFREAEKLAELVYHRASNYSQASSALEIAIQTNPGRGTLYARLAFMKRVNKKLDSPHKHAQDILTAGLANSRNNKEDIYCVQAALASENKDWDLARKARKRAGKNNFMGLLTYSWAMEKEAHKDLKGAERALRNALKIVPELSFFQRALARVLASRNKKRQAIQLLESILQLHPRDPVARQMIITYLADEKRTQEALKHEEIMMEYNPEESEQIIKDMIQADPDNIENHYAYAKVIAKTEDRREEALNLLNDYLEKQPYVYKVLMLKGNILKDLEKFSEAEEVFRQAIKHHPESVGPWITLSETLLMQDRWEEAEEAAIKAYKTKMDFSTCMSLAMIFKELGGHNDRVIELYDQAIQLNPDNPTAKWNKALVYYHNNRIPEAMELYRHGFEAGPRKPFRKFAVPEWDGKASIKNKRILCWREQGVGDEIRYAKFYQELVNTGAHCVFEVSPKLKPLLKRSFPAAEVIIQSGGDDLTRTDIDLHIPAGELMRFFPRDYPEPPVYKNHFILDHEHIQKWKDRFSTLGPGKLAGISWRSMLQTASRGRYYMTLDDLEPILKLPGVTWINLQYDECREELAYAKDKLGITIHNWEDLNQKDDLDQTAAMASLLDLIITAPTSVSELGAAIGVPTMCWYVGATMEHKNEPVISHLSYPLLQFKRYYKQSKHDIAQQIAEYVRSNYL